MSSVRILKTEYRTTYLLEKQPHRLDGPAVESADGSKFWYLDDRKFLAPIVFKREPYNWQCH